jgi:hypothetical protein
MGNNSSSFKKSNKDSVNSWNLFQLNDRIFRVSPLPILELKMFPNFSRYCLNIESKLRLLSRSKLQILILLTTGHSTQISTNIFHKGRLKYLNLLTNDPPPGISQHQNFNPIFNNHDTRRGEGPHGSPTPSILAFPYQRPIAIFAYLDVES